ncbi:MAG: hypothetical protein JWN78_910 [Bacteroidota bacterium]|nr:hypothetical protein [Bacteroidota bacterium]
MTKLRKIIRDIVRQQFELQQLQPQMIPVKRNGEKLNTPVNSRKTFPKNF